MATPQNWNRVDFADDKSVFVGPDGEFIFVDGDSVHVIKDGQLVVEPSGLPSAAHSRAEAEKIAHDFSTEGKTPTEIRRDREG